MPDTISSHLAANVRQLREARAMTQEQMARLSDVPRPTWANLESGEANPTLSVLIKVANALQVPLEELVGPPRSGVKLYKAASLPVTQRGKVRIRRLLPEAVPGFEIDRMELAVGSYMTGVPHTPGTREYLTCESGVVELSVAESNWTLHAGDVVVFRGDQKHAYRNPGAVISVAYSVLSLAAV